MPADQPTTPVPALESQEKKLRSELIHEDTTGFSNELNSMKPQDRLQAMRDIKNDFDSFPKSAGFPDLTIDTHKDSNNNDVLSDVKQENMPNIIPFSGTHEAELWSQPTSESIAEKVAPVVNEYNQIPGIGH